MKNHFIIKNMNEFSLEMYAYIDIHRKSIFLKILKQMIHI